MQVLIDRRQKKMSREESQNVYEKGGHADNSTPALGNAKMRLPIDDEYHWDQHGSYKARKRRVKVITGTRANTIFHDRVIGRMEKLTSPKSIVCAPEQVEVGATSARMNLKIDQSVGESGGDLLLSPSPAGESVGESAFNLEGSGTHISTDLSLVADLESSSGAGRLGDYVGMSTQPSDVTLATNGSTQSDITNATQILPQRNPECAFLGPFGMAR